MRITALIMASFMLVLLSFGCGGGSDPSFSPDPSVGGLPGGDGDSPAGGGDAADATADGSKSEMDCFEDGFCSLPCETPQDCPPGFSCILSMCTFDCQSDEECGRGGICNDAGLCEAADGEPMPGCTADAECGAGRYCTPEGLCEKVPYVFACARDADCPVGQYCDGDHACQVFPAAGVACTADADCPGNYHCDETQMCVQECLTEAQCAEGQACNSRGRCVAVDAPAMFASFSFNGAGTVADPAGPAVFESLSFRVDMAEVVPVARGDILSSASFRLIGSASNGYLTDAKGLDLDRTVGVELRIYDSLIAGTGQDITNSHVLYAEIHPAVEVQGGHFRVAAGSGTPLDAKWAGLPLWDIANRDAVYMELWIDGERLSPRQRLGSMPGVFQSDYALFADHVENLPPLTGDSMPSYDAGLIKAGTLSTDCVPGGLNVGIIDGQLAAGNIPSLNANSFSQTGSLPIELIGSMDAGKIGTGTLSRERLPEGYYIARDNFVVLSGSVADEQMLVFPSGFDESECQYMLTPSVTLGSVEGIDQIYLDKSDADVVTCKVDKHEASDNQSETVPCTANYMIICRKGS